MARCGVGWLLLLILVVGGCTSNDVEKVANDPQVDSALELAKLIEGGTGNCDDVETPIAIQMPGLDRAMCTVLGHQVTITVLTDEPAQGRSIAGHRGFTTDRTGSPTSRLIGHNWVLVGHPEALTLVQQAIGGDLESD